MNLESFVATYFAEVTWALKSGEQFNSNRYSRAHTWQFDGGLEVPASSSPHVVPLPMSDATAVDPEEAFIASLSSCHMLWFLSIAARRSFSVLEYRDLAQGTMGKNKNNKMAMLRVELSPQCTFAQERVPSAEELDAMHQEAHDNCYIANSVTTEVICHPRN